VPDVAAAIIWGLIQGLTEFLPVSSSGHLVIIPAFLAEFGVEIAPPSLAITAVLHLGTLLAVLIYFREDVMKVLRLRAEPEGRKIALLVAIGTIPAIVGLPLKDNLELFQATVSNVGWALMATGVILVIGQRLATARFSFLLGIPAIAGAGLTQLPDLLGSGEYGAELIVGFAVAAVSVYFAIAWLLAALRRIGLIPFAVYCLAVGLLTVVVF